MKKFVISNTLIQKIFGILVLLIMTYFCLGEILVEENRPHMGEECQIFVGDWERIMPDGSRVPVEVPGEVAAKRKEEVVIETVLPNDIRVGTSLCMRSSQQDMKIYIDGDLRQYYTTKDTRLFGRNSMSVFVFVEVYPDDSGKTLQIRTMSDSVYTGHLNELYVGREMVIWNYFMRLYGLEMVVGLCTMVLGIAVILASEMVRRFYHKNITLHYLGWGIFLVSFWLLAESKLRQIMLPNNTIFGTMAYLTLMLVIIPFMLYFNGVQNYRYQRCYLTISMVAVINTIVSVGLQLRNIIDFLDMIPVTNFIMVVSFVAALITIIIDWKKGYINEYRLIAMGYVGIIISGTAEVVCVYISNYRVRGIVTSIGLIFLLVMACVKTGADIIKTEDERRMTLISNQSKTEFLIDMSQEIRGPINSMLGMNELILKEEKDDRIKEYALGIRRTGYVLQNMMDELIDYSQIEVGKMELMEGQYYFNALIQDVISLAETRCKKKKLYFESQVDNQVPEILLGDEVRIKQVLTNIIDNAIKYTAEGNILLQVNVDKKTENNILLKIVIEDTGIGISEADVECLFEQFSAFDKSNTKQNGLELGLSISKRLVELMNGKYRVQSIYGQGAKFTIEIPQKVISLQTVVADESEDVVNLQEKNANGTFIDKEQVMSYCSNDEDTFYRLMRIYFVKAKKHAEQIEVAMAEKDYKTYSVILHAMKSASLTIGVNLLTDLIVRQENAIHEEQYDLLEKNHQEFYNCYLDVLKETEDILQTKEIL